MNSIKEKDIELFLGKAPIQGYEIIAHKTDTRKGWGSQWFEIDEESLWFNKSDFKKSTTTYNYNYVKISLDEFYHNNNLFQLFKEKIKETISDALCVLDRSIKTGDYICSGGNVFIFIQYASSKELIIRQIDFDSSSMNIWREMSSINNLKEELGISVKDIFLISKEIYYQVLDIATGCIIEINTYLDCIYEKSKTNQRRDVPVSSSV